MVGFLLPGVESAPGWAVRGTRWHRRVRSLALVASLAILDVAAAAPAAAQRGAPSRPPRPPSVQTSAVDREARALFEAGVEAFTAARYDRALDYFRRAHELSPRPQMLYNIGLSADRLRRDAEALEAFERYLSEVPDAAERDAVLARIEFLRAATAPPPTAVADADAGTDSGAPDGGAGAADDAAGRAAPAAEGPGPLPWVLTLGGGALAIAGGALLVGALVNQGRLADAEDGATWRSYESYYDTANLFGGVGWALLGVGAAVAGVGVVLLATARRGPSDAASGRRPALALGVGPGSLALRGTF